MPKFYTFKNGRPIVYDLGKTVCPVCGAPTVGYFQSGKLIKTEPCTCCSQHEGKWGQ